MLKLHGTLATLRFQFVSNIYLNHDKWFSDNDGENAHKSKKLSVLEKQT